MSDKTKEEPRKLWGGRFSGKTDPLMEKYNASIGIDKRLVRVEISSFLLLQIPSCLINFNASQLIILLFILCL